MKNSRHIGKKFEWLFREVRSYLSKENWQTYRELKHDRNLPSKEGKLKLVLFDFGSIAIDNVGGRYLYRIVQDFVHLGYIPCYKNNFRFTSNIRSKGFKKHLLKLDYVFYSEQEELSALGEIEVLFSDKVTALKSSSAAIKIFVDYTLRLAEAGEMALNFGPSPVLLKDGLFSEEVDIKSERLNTLFFAGRTRAEEYGRDLLGENYSMLNRLETIEVLRTFEVERGLVAKNQLAEDEWSKPHDLLLVSNDVCKIPLDKWMEVMAKSDFFLACPGAEMPLCHNVIECIAAGTIPIIEYPKYVKPGLEDGVNCLAFNGASELLVVLQKAMSMSESEKHKMRGSVIEFYQKYYSKGSFAKRLINTKGTTLVMNDYRIRIE